mmetsp:Transcript_314/g.779  ORF Transcript_314/g.779 Transcript_314/m.779 type:complete len:87 (+) Transcript_314:517-777(+)
MSGPTLIRTLTFTPTLNLISSPQSDTGRPTIHEYRRWTTLYKSYSLSHPHSHPNQGCVPLTERCMSFGISSLFGPLLSHLGLRAQT